MPGGATGCPCSETREEAEARASARLNNSLSKSSHGDLQHWSWQLFLH